MEPLPPLNALRAFEAAARLGSFKEAGEELCVTPAAVSYQIRSLESHLGNALFHRTTHGLELTQAGETYLPVVQDVYERLVDATRRIMGQQNSQTLKINVLPTFASSWLVPRIWKFHEIYPEIELQISSNRTLGTPVDFARNDADIAIRGGMDAAQWPNLQAEKLIHEEMYPVCSPVLMTGADQLRTPEDLRGHTLIYCSSAPEGWNSWLHEAEARGCDISGICPSHGLSFDTIQMAQDACALGQGVVIGREPLVNIYLETGRLIAPFDFSVRSQIAYWLVGPKHAFERTCVLAFRDWILGELEGAA
jgi:LysR family glycine cleavage system transcriptional activator